jgi:hypothetical protein
MKLIPFHMLELEDTEVSFGRDYGKAVFQLQLPIGGGINSFTYKSPQNAAPSMVMGAFSFFPLAGVGKMTK